MRLMEIDKRADPSLADEFFNTYRHLMCEVTDNEMFK
jgi:hypothetical protein